MNTVQRDAQDRGDLLRRPTVDPQRDRPLGLERQPPERLLTLRRDGKLSRALRDLQLILEQLAGDPIAALNLVKILSSNTGFPIRPETRSMPGRAKDPHELIQV